MPSGVLDKTNITLYADDTKIWRTIDSPGDNENLQQDINYLNNWANCNKMKFHPTKCKVLSVRHRAPSHLFPYKLGDTTLDYTECEKDLGVDITPTLNWSHHCDRIYSKASQIIGLLKRNCYIVNDSKRRRVLYLTLVRSLFEHCSIIWRPSSNKSLMDKLERIQKKAVKWILFEELTSYSDYKVYISKCKQVDILPLLTHFDINDLTYLHKIIHNILPVSLPSYLTLFEGNSRLRSCHLDSLSLVSSIHPKTPKNLTSDNSRASSNALGRSFFYRTHNLWNTIPFEIRSTAMTALFKKKLENYFWTMIQSEYLCQDEVS